MKAEIIGSTEVFEYPFRILWPVGGRSAGNNEVRCTLLYSQTLRKESETGTSESLD